MYHLQLKSFDNVWYIAAQKIGSALLSLPRGDSENVFNKKIP